MHVESTGQGSPGPGNPFLADFPILSSTVHERGFIYFDNAATTLKPRPVIEAVSSYYEKYTSNVSRGNHYISEIATLAFESAREKVASFIKAQSNEIIFTYNCTDSINLVASALSLTPEDEVVISVMEHHSNHLPWHGRARLKIVGVDSSGCIDLNQLQDAITDKTKLVSLSCLSNVTGNIQPVKAAVALARERGVLTLLDAAQAIGHFPFDVRELGCDFLAFSAHKMLGPSGVGVLYARQEAQAALRPVRYGGGMTNKLTRDGVVFRDGPARFEAGTPGIEGIIAFGAAVDYFRKQGFDAIRTQLEELESYCWSKLSQMDAIVHPFPMAPKHAPIFAFRPRKPGVDLNYVTRILSDSHGLALSAGYQCCQPLYEAFNVNGAIRVSLYIYNTRAEIDRLVGALEELRYFIA
ncbi:aminotransferase, class V [Stigmatella aurantiaca DW4/3-1]|nr:aminotransferase, class V [Stigmatella aurantiaca DW4/3-1]